MQRPLIGFTVGFALGFGLSASSHAESSVPALTAGLAERRGDQPPLRLKRSLVLTRAAFSPAGNVAPARRDGMLYLRLDTEFATGDATGAGLTSLFLRDV